MKGRALLSTLDDHRLGPTDMTKASLVDRLATSQHKWVQHHPEQLIEVYHSMTLMFDEWGVLLSSFEGDMIPILTSFYDVTVPYEQTRRHQSIDVKIERPQLNILAGSTPSNLLKFIPDFAWDQGFTSRLILVYSSERVVGDDFAMVSGEVPQDLIDDLAKIAGMTGEFTIDPSFALSVKKWRAENELPCPTHPKLKHYNARRRAHVYKLSMVAAANHSSRMVLDSSHFDAALCWLHEVEQFMPDIFSAGAVSVDARAMDEIIDFIRTKRKPVSEGQILRFASSLLPSHSVIKVLFLMQVSQRITKVGDDPITYLVNEHLDD